MTKIEAGTIAAETLRQLGGNKFLAMTGASGISFGMEGQLTMRLPRNEQGVGLLKIALADDLYELTAYTGRNSKKDGPTGKVLAVVPCVFAANLAGMFEAITGLYVSL